MSNYIGPDLILGTLHDDVFSGDGTTTQFTLTGAPGSVTGIIVFVDGAPQPRDSYTVSGTTLTFTEAPGLPKPGDTYNIFVFHLGAKLDIGTPGDGTVGTAQLQALAVTAAKMANSRRGPSYARLTFTQPNATGGGTPTANAWTKYPINTEDEDADGIVTLATNQITLEAGTYRMNGGAAFWRPGVVRLRLRNITDSTTDLLGLTGLSSSSANSQHFVPLKGEFTIAAQKTFEVQYYITNAVATVGLGTYAGAYTEEEVYGIFEIEKVK